MAVHIVKGTRLFAGGLDLASRNNKVELSAEVEEKDATTFADIDANGDVWKALRGGLSSAKLNASGFWESDGVGAVDDVLWALLASGVTPWTIAPSQITAVGDTVYTTLADESSYKVLGQVGEIAPWEASMTSAYPLARGIVVNTPGTARTATGTATPIDFGTTWPAGKSMYASLHVLSVSGTTPSATFRIETAPTLGFASPTTRLTFAAATARGGQLLRTSANITDQYVRAAWTISGTTPSFLALVTVGIANT